MGSNYPYPCVDHSEARARARCTSIPKNRLIPPPNLHHKRMSTSVVWFRKSLRLHDNPALTQACEDSSVDFILPIFILDPKVVGEKFEKYGKNRIRFLLESLEDLDLSLVSKAKSPLLFSTVVQMRCWGRLLISRRSVLRPPFRILHV